LQALFSGAPLRRERIRLRIVQGRVTLSGTVGTNEERVAIERLVAGVEGVADIVNLVAVERHGRTAEVARGVAEAYGGDAESGDVAGRIEAVFVREAGLGATKVMITAVGGKVVLSGHVHSWRARPRRAHRLGAPRRHRGDGPYHGPIAAMAAQGPRAEGAAREGD